MVIFHSNLYCQKVERNAFWGGPEKPENQRPAENIPKNLDNLEVKSAKKYKFSAHYVLLYQLVTL